MKEDLGRLDGPADTAERRDNPAMNDVLRDDYIDDCENAVRRWSKAVQAEGVDFKTNVEVGGAGMKTSRLLESYDAIVMSGGAEHPRDLEVTFTQGFQDIVHELRAHIVRARQ